jgi:hypothetical protein
MIFIYGAMTLYIFETDGTNKQQTGQYRLLCLMRVTDGTNNATDARKK